MSGAPKGVISVDETHDAAIATDVQVEVNAHSQTCADNQHSAYYQTYSASDGGLSRRTIVLVVAVLGVTALAIGLGIGLGMDDESSSPLGSRTTMKQSIVAPVSPSRRADIYIGSIKRVYEEAYLLSLGLSTSVATIQSVATAITPTTSSIQFVLNVDNDLLKSATSKASSLTASSFVSAMNSAISSVDSTLTGILTSDITVQSPLFDNDFCIQGVCQVTSVAEFLAGIEMNLLGAAKYFWAEASDAGTFTYAGDTEAYVSFSRVKAEMMAMPAKFHNAEAFKPNDLGLLRLNGEIFTYSENPAIALGAPLAMHAKLRPALMTMFANESEWSVDVFAQEAKTFLSAMKAGGEVTQSNISAWSQQMLHKYGLKHDISLQEAAAYQSYGLSALANSILPYAAFNNKLGGLVEAKLQTSDVRAENAAKLETYSDLAKKRCPFMHFSDADATMVAHGLVDGALTFAGGISVPGLITSMLAVVYSGDYGDFTDPAVYSSSAFVWEVVRYFPAVVGVPFVQTGTTKRQACLIPGALSDKSVWGDDAFDFVLRADSVYDGNIDVAWSGFTNDPKYPNDSHSCPGMGMSKAMLLGFMEALEYTDWSTNIKPKQVTQAPIAWNSFALKKK